MNAKINLILHGIANILGNAAVIGIVPDEYKIWVLAVFNVAQVIYAAIDPTYTVEQIKLGKVDLNK